MARKCFFNLSFVLLSFIFLCLIQVTYAQYVDQTSRLENSIWATGNSYTINIQIPPLYQQKITVMAQNLDNINIELEGMETGKLKLIEGKTLITQGINSTDQFMIDRLDSASFFTQLVINLLEDAIPEGPQLKNAKQINLKEKHKTLITGSQNILPPWELTGTVTPLEGGVIDFNFKLYVENINITLKGSWEKQNPAPQMDDNMSLEGWKMYTLGIREFKDGKSTILDYGTTEVPLNAKTLGELRKNLPKHQ